MVVENLLFARFARFAGLPSLSEKSLLLGLNINCQAPYVRGIQRKKVQLRRSHTATPQKFSD
jgi:hypothetical protein